MTKEFKYMKEGISVDIAQFLMEDYSIDLQTALSTLYDSETYSKLTDPTTGLYFQSSRYVYHYLKCELRNGRL